jgi:hypothetical protein
MYKVRTDGTSIQDKGLKVGTRWERGGYRWNFFFLKPKDGTFLRADWKKNNQSAHSKVPISVERRARHRNVQTKEKKINYLTINQSSSYIKFITELLGLLGDVTD